MLSGTQVFMTQHFAHTFDGHAIGECYGGCKSVAGDMERKFFVNLTNCGNFFEIGIHLLVAQNW